MPRDIINRIVSFVLAIVIMTGVIWLMSGSIRPNELSNSTVMAASPTVADTAKPMNTDPASMSNSKQQQESEEPGKIYKCGSRQRPTYSDKKCLNTDHSANVDIRETSGGFVSPDQQTIAATRARIDEDIQRPGNVATTGRTTANNNQACPYLEAEINAIDAASKQGQDWRSQERLRIRREKVRTDQYRAGC